MVLDHGELVELARMRKLLACEVITSAWYRRKEMNRMRAAV